LGALDLRTYRLEEGHALTRYGDPGWGELVRSGKYEANTFDDQLVEASANLVRTWAPTPPPTWLTTVPNRTTGGNVISFARRLADALGIEFVEAVVRVANNRPQKEMQNSYQQAKNVLDAFTVRDVRTGPALLVDDIVDSRWTLTVIGNLLLQEGTSAVYPFALADAGRG
jgi:ATP-dependent DNA helicase RecQ